MIAYSWLSDYILSRIERKWSFVDGGAGTYDPEAPTYESYARGGIDGGGEGMKSSSELSSEDRF